MPKVNVPLVRPPEAAIRPPARISAPAAKPAKQNTCAAHEHTVKNAATNDSAPASSTEGTASEGRSGHLLPEAGVGSRRHAARAKAKEGTPAPSMGHVGC